MKKIFLFFVTMLSLCGCSSSYNDYHDMELLPQSSSSQLIIYTLNYTLYVDDLSEAIDLVEGLDYDMWLSEKTVYDNYAYLNLRVLTSSLDSFQEDTEELGRISNYSIQSQDITNTYYDLENEKNRLTAEYDRLIELIDESTVSEIIIINTRLFEIEKELTEINKELTDYDSSILYSFVNIRISQNSLEESFGAFIATVFSSGCTFIIVLAKYSLAALVFLVPISLCITPVVIGVVVYNKRKKKKQSKKEEDK